MELENIFFTSELFGIESEEDEVTNPGIYGKQLAKWLQERLLEKGYKVEKIYPEDWGWCVMYSEKPFKLWVGCSSIIENENIIWSCFSAAEVPTIKNIFKKINVEPSLTKLNRSLKEIIKSENKIIIVNEP